tara:strand:+ start:1066 stop:2445 length:1380 start_codon:yes stop_codon:yes gene_type:complete
MKLKAALLIQEGLDPAIVNDIVDVAKRPEFGSISGMDKVAEKEWSDISQLIRYIKEAIPTSTHYLFDTEVSKLDDRLPDTEIDQNLNEYGLPGNLGREFGERYIKEFINPGKFAGLWTAFESTYPELKSQLQTTFEKTNNLFKYIKPDKGDETYRVSTLSEAAAQELNEYLDLILEEIEKLSNLDKAPNQKMVLDSIQYFDNLFQQMLDIFTSNTIEDLPLEPYKTTNIGFKEDALSKSKSNYSNWKKDNKTMKMKKLSEIYEETTADTTAEYKELQSAWRNLDGEERKNLLLPFIKKLSDEPNMEWIEFYNKRPGIANNSDFQNALIDSVEQQEYDRGFYTEEKEETDEGTCGYGIDGKPGKKPAGPYMIQERFQELAGIKPLYEQSFDDRLKAAGGFSDEEMDDITSRDPEMLSISGLMKKNEERTNAVAEAIANSYGIENDSRLKGIIKVALADYI